MPHLADESYDSSTPYRTETARMAVCRTILMKTIMAINRTAINRTALQGATRGVTVSTSAFLACHQNYCAGSSLAWGLNLRALVCGIF